MNHNWLIDNQFSLLKGSGNLTDLFPIFVVLAQSYRIFACAFQFLYKMSPRFFSLFCTSFGAKPTTIGKFSAFTISTKQNTKQQMKDQGNVSRRN